MFQHRHAVRSIAGLAVLVLAACSSPAGPSEPLPVTRITQGSFSNLQTPQRRVIRSQADLTVAWGQVFGGPLKLPPPLPSIDFSSEMVILVAAGEKPTNGFCISVEAASGNEREAIVTVLSLGPPPPGGMLPATTQPFDMVRLPRRNEVTFEERSETRQCALS